MFFIYLFNIFLNLKNELRSHSHVDFSFSILINCSIFLPYLLTLLVLEYLSYVFKAKIEENTLSFGHLNQKDVTSNYYIGSFRPHLNFFNQWLSFLKLRWFPF